MKQNFGVFKMKKVAPKDILMGLIIVPNLLQQFEHPGWLMLQIALSAYDIYIRLYHLIDSDDIMSIVNYTYTDANMIGHE